MLVKYAPFEVAETFPSLFDSLFQGSLFTRAPSLARVQADPSLSPAAEIEETENALLLKVDLPGHDPKNIQVQLEGDTLTITSERKAERSAKGDSYFRTERRYGTYARSFVLPKSVDGQKVEARYEHGVLELTLPKKEESKPRVIGIRVQS